MIHLFASMIMAIDSGDRRLVLRSDLLWLGLALFAVDPGFYWSPKLMHQRTHRWISAIFLQYLHGFDAFRLCSRYNLRNR